MKRQRCHGNGIARESRKQVCTENGDSSDVEASCADELDHDDCGNLNESKRRCKNGGTRHNVARRFKASRTETMGKLPCVRVAIFGVGSVDDVCTIMNWFQAEFGCKYYGGFARDRIWEAIVTFDKNKCELPYEIEIERMLSWLGANFAVDTLDATITQNVLAFFYRIASLCDRFGQPPNRLRSRLSEYHQEVIKNKDNDSVERYTGLRVCPETVLKLYETVQDLQNEVVVSHKRVAELTDSLRTTQSFLDQSNMVILQTRAFLERFISENNSLREARWQNLTPSPLPSPPPPPLQQACHPSHPGSRTGSHPSSPSGSPPVSPH